VLPIQPLSAAPALTPVHLPFNPKGGHQYLLVFSPRKGRVLRLPTLPRLAEFHSRDAMSTGGSSHTPTLLNERAGAGLHPY